MILMTHIPINDVYTFIKDRTQKIYYRSKNCAQWNYEGALIFGKQKHILGFIYLNRETQ